MRRRDLSTERKDWWSQKSQKLNTILWSSIVSYIVCGVLRHVVCVYQNYCFCTCAWFFFDSLVFFFFSVPGLWLGTREHAVGGAAATFLTVVRRGVMVLLDRFASKRAQKFVHRPTPA